MNIFPEFTREELDKIRREAIDRDWEIAINDKNRFSNWYPKVKDIFLTPKSLIIPIDKDKEFEWLDEDLYPENKIKELNERLEKIAKQELPKLGINPNEKLFVKTGVFSNKFAFDISCGCENAGQLGSNFANAFYGAMCVGCTPSAEIVVREFIPNRLGRKHIYKGMCLHTEFRAFVGMNTKKVYDIVNYWDKSIVNQLYGDDKTTFIEQMDGIEIEFNAKKLELQTLIEEKIDMVNGLDGIWSMDFLYDGCNFWLIDMAFGPQSAYYSDLIKKGIVPEDGIDIE